MQIKTADGERNVASQGVAGTALGLGIAGTLGFLNQFANGGGLFGGRVVSCGNGSGVVSDDTRLIGALESKIAKLESERYTDGVGIELYKEIVAKSNANDDKIQANYVELAKAVAELDKKVAVERQQTIDNFAFLNNEICNTKKEIMCYVNATFVPGKLVMPLDSICPPAAAATTTT
ncbi:MAG: hypothetical protein IKY94_06650 [Lachnospiraceae bacterium]|nr:hypothetical protein [Clostridia bacterium]MBR4982220.1 hypothetical protein [Lachnospiraceae bacterium]